MLSVNEVDVSSVSRPNMRARYMEADQRLSKKAVSLTKGFPMQLSDEDLARIEAVIENSKDEFTTSVLARLRHLRGLVTTMMQTGEDSQAALAMDVKATAYEIKGLGGMFGYPNLTSVASMLHKYVDAKMVLTRKQLLVVGVHIDLLYVILVRKISIISPSLEAELAAALALLVARWP